MRVPRKVPRRECESKPVEQCEKIPRKVPRQVAEKVKKYFCKKKYSLW